MSPLAYKAGLTNSFLKELKRLPEDLGSRVLKAINLVFDSCFFVL